MAQKSVDNLPPQTKAQLREELAQIKKQLDELDNNSSSSTEEEPVKPKKQQRAPRKRKMPDPESQLEALSQMAAEIKPKAIRKRKIADDTDSESPKKKAKPALRKTKKINLDEYDMDKLLSDVEKIKDKVNQTHFLFANLPVEEMQKKIAALENKASRSKGIDRGVFDPDNSILRAVSNL